MLDTEDYKHIRQHMQYLQLFHQINGCTNEPQFYVIRTLFVLLIAGYKCK